METETHNPRRVILASGSPRRKELMARIGFDTRVISADVPEVRGDEAPTDYTQRLAKEKAQWVAEREVEASERWVLAADTIVVLDGDVLEKPIDKAEAISMLQRLSGKVHTVVTSFCWLSIADGREHVETVSTEVTMRELKPASIVSYVESGEPMDKAGAYGIQEVGAAFVRSIDGSYFGVMGLPVCEVVEALEAMGELEEYPFYD